MAHLWHGISTGANPPLDINVIIEIPSGSKCKYELDKVAGIIRVDRIIASAVYYPIPLHKQKAFENACKDVSLPVTEDVVNHCMSLPVYPELANEQIQHIVDVIKSAI